MKKRKNFRKKPKEKKMNGLQVDVYNNNVDQALRILKKKVKDANLFLDLKKKQYYEKPSKKRREKKNLAILRNKYKVEKKKEASEETRSVRECTHPQRTRRQEQAEKLRKARAKRTDKQQLAELDRVFGKGKGAKKERARLKERIKNAKTKQD